MAAWELIARLIAGVFLIAANAFFVVTEFALTRIPQFDKSKFNDHPGLKLAWKMTEKLEIYLTGCQLGITSTSILLGVVAEPAVTHLIRPLVGWTGIEGQTLSTVSIVVSIVLINLIHKIWGEQAPTYLGVERPIQVAKYTSWLHYWWCKIMYPFIILGDSLAKSTLRLINVEINRSWTQAESEQLDETAGAESGERRGSHSYAEVRQKIGEVLSRGSLSHDRQQEVIRALDIDRIPVNDIMVPRDDINAISTEDDIETSLRKMADEKGLSRFPLVKNSLDEPVGTLYLAAVFRHLDALRAGETSLGDIAVPAIQVDHDLPVSRLIDHLQDKQQELALVQKQGRIIGLATITDALEAIAGNLEDPLDVEAI